MKEEW